MEKRKWGLLQARAATRAEAISLSSSGFTVRRSRIRWSSSMRAITGGEAGGVVPAVLVVRGFGRGGSCLGAGGGWVGWGRDGHQGGGEWLSGRGAASDY